MKIKSKLGILGVIFISVLTILVWFYVRQGTEKFDSYDIASHSLGQLSGLVGMTLFALTFILTTRLRWVEKSFGGLDKVYRTHHIMGAIAFILLLFHPLLLVLKFIPDNIKQAAIYLSPSNSWAVNFGIVALLSMTLLIILTLYINLKYQNWKLSHKLMGIVYFLAILHIFLVTTDISIYPLLKYYMGIISLIGLFSHIYGSYIRLATKKLVYIVDSVQVKDKVTIIELKPQDKKLEFKPGQFAFIRVLDNNIGKESHPFTIASSPLNDKIRFAIKSLGDYTSRIREIKPGTSIEIEGPFGEFTPVDCRENLVFIAGGIGITPFLSIIEFLRKSPPRQKITMFYCTNDLKEAIFLNELEKASKDIKNFKVSFWCANEKGHINSDIIEKIAGLDNVFYICGPPSMMKSLKKQLVNKGISKSNIRMEDFGLR
jgi:predicted ferric reductase